MTMLDAPYVILEIPYKFPSLNDYTAACRGNAYGGAAMKKKVQKAIAPSISMLPVFEKPVVIDFHWVEGNNRRDYDNIAFAKKFILDSMVECGRLKDDNRKFVIGFSDTFGFEKNVFKLVMVIREVSEVAG